MYKKTKQPTYCFRLDEKLARKLDRRIERIGYTSRSDFFSAVAYVALYGDKTGHQMQNESETDSISNLPETVTTWLREVSPRITEEEIQSALCQIIAEMLTPAIAMKGVDIVYENTWEDVRRAFHEKTDIWATESDIREAYIFFATVRKAELMAYRENQLKNND